MAEILKIDAEKFPITIKNRDDGFLTIRQVARLLNIETNTVRIWSKIGVLKPYSSNNGDNCRYKYDDIKSFLGK
jgi:hypothetical protein